MQPDGTTARTNRAGPPRPSGFARKSDELFVAHWPDVGVRPGHGSKRRDDGSHYYATSHVPERRGAISANDQRRSVGSVESEALPTVNTKGVAS